MERSVRGASSGHVRRLRRPGLETSEDLRWNLSDGSEDHQAPNDVLQLADVSRPRVFLEAFHAVGRELHLSSVLLLEFLQEVGDETRNLFSPLAEWRNSYLYHIEAVVDLRGTARSRGRLPSPGWWRQ